MVKAKKSGFTLIELMITLAIIAVLAAVAIPSYSTYVVSANRTAAQAAMMDIANREQQWLLANRTYAASTDASWTTAYSSLPSDVAKNYTYTIVLGAGEVPFYTITLTPKAGTSQANDGTLTLTSAGVKGVDASKWKS